MSIFRKGILITAATFSMAAGAATWSKSSISYLNGSDFELGGKNRSEITYDNAIGMEYGDSYFWLDVTNPQQNDDSDFALYGEWSPRLSLGKIFKKHDKNRFIQDILLAGTLEFGKSGVASQSRLYGIGFDLKIPYFAFFNANFYVRDNINKGGTTFQTTLSYLLPVNVSDKLKFSYGAYIDFVHGDEGNKSDNTLVEAHWHTGQQVLMDIGALVNKAGSLHAGIEYQYWNRKFGGENNPVESNLKWMVKYVF